MFQGGYMGRYAFVDLSAGTCETRELDETYAKLFIGGPALGARMLLDLMPAGAGPFDEKSVCGLSAVAGTESDRFLCRSTCIYSFAVDSLAFHTSRSL